MLDEAHFDIFALKLLLIEVLNRASQIGLCVTDAGIGQQKTCTKCDRTEYVAYSETQGTGPVSEQNLVEAGHHVCKLIF